MSATYEIAATIRLRAASAEDAEAQLQRMLGSALWDNERPEALAVTPRPMLTEQRIEELYPTEVPKRVGARPVGPCPCECNRGGFCGGCGHAGCGGRR